MMTDDLIDMVVGEDDGDADDIKPGSLSIEVIDKPISQRLKPEEELHGEILGKLITRRNASKSHRGKRESSWKSTNNRLRMYIDLNENKKDASGKATDKKEHPFKYSVVVPASYSILHVLLTQLMSIFGSRDPMIQVRGRGPEDVESAKIMEAVLAYDLEHMNAIRPIYSICQDALKFGGGIVYDSWATEMGMATVRKPIGDDPASQLMLALLGPAAFVSREFGVVNEYNRWDPISPFDYYPDPRVPFGDPQEGEYCGHRFYRGYIYLKERSEEYDGYYFNIDRIKGLNGRSSREDYSPNTSFDSYAVDELDRGSYDLDHMQVKIIPKEWGLSDTEHPEIWWFTWVNDQVIIRAHPCPYEHSQFSYSVAESDPDFHSAFSPGIIESLDGLQKYMDWMFNSHLQNLMRHLNDAMIFAPAMIETSDITNPGPGRHIRLTQLGEELLMSGGYSIDNFVHQLPVQDVTGPHLNAVNQMFTLAQRMSAANDPQMGMPTPERKTLGEIQVISSAASQRISLIARMIDALALSPLAKRSIQNRMQFTETEKYFRIVGDAASKENVQYVLANRDNIRGNFDYVPFSGVMPPDPVRLARTWAQVLETLSRLAPVMPPSPDGKVPDLNKVAKESFKALGAKNIEDFFVDVQVQPDEQVAAEAQAGNMVPVQEMDPAAMGG